MKRVLVTGAASGIGAALYRLLEEDGIEAVGLDLTGSDIDCDLTREDAVAALASRVRGPLHGIAHVAGLPGTAPAAQIMAVNASAPMHVTRTLLHHLVEESAIVVVSSITALRCEASTDRLDAFIDGTAQTDPQIDGKAAYELSKAVVNRWALRSVADLSGRRIRINTVSPGPIETPILIDFERSIGADRIAGAAALAGRHGDPREVAQVCRFLLSSDASWVNGADVKVDGGYHAMRAAGAGA